MDQLSLPYRIALGAFLVFGLLYLFVLKGGGDTQTAATAPGVAGLATAVDKAHGAAATQTVSGAATQAAADGASGAATPAPASATPGTTAPTPPAVTTSDNVTAPQAGRTADGGTDPSAPILAELREGHTAVVLFAGTKASDDRSVRRAVRRVDGRNGKVDVHVVSIKRVGDYEAITRGVDVLQSPTVLVISKQRTARTIVGYTTTSEINQLVADTRRG